MKAAELFVKCLENEGVEYIFGVPGEENVDIMDALLDSSIRFVTTRHEQGAAFMADVYGRLAGKAGVCLSTLGPGATNLITGVADADMDRAPLVAVAGQGATTRMHKERHQILDLVNMFEPITKYTTQIREPEIVTEIVRKAFKVAQTEKRRMYQAERPNTCIISNGFASMGIAVPGAIAAKLAHPNRKVVAVTGDAGFMMNSQEIETALRVATPCVILIWNDSEYGLITWHQLRRFGRPSHIGFKNPDFVKYAESFGAKGYRVERAADLLPILKQALADDTVAIVDRPVDYAENMRLTRKLEKLISPV
jgi:thiamine pyrophosphate-dependent acetolactate synthase large subunit-like protein